MRARSLALVLAAAAGAVAAYLADPQMGRTRRAKLTDQAGARLRRGRRAAARRARNQRGQLGGIAHRATHRRAHPPENDPALVDKVRSEVLGRHPELRRQISVDAANGVVTVRGELVDTVAGEALVTSIRKVAGVDDVVNLLHRPGEPPANKTDALRTVRSG
jgi:osmotically-inducible protein OsmY